MSRTFIGGAICRELKIGGAGGRRNVRLYRMQLQTVQFALKVAMVVELFVTGEFQTAITVILNALDWKLILVAG